MSQIGALRNYYRQMIAALPWLDGWRLDEEFAAPFEYKCDLSHFPAPEKGKISLWQQECGDLSDFMRQRFSEGKIPAVRHDQITNTELVAALKSNAQIPLILGSGDKKLIYFIDELVANLKNFPNLYLATANLCNFQVFDFFNAEKLFDQLLWGSLSPLHDPNAAAGILIFSSLAPEIQAKIAGNNLRRLLNIPEISQFNLPDRPQIAPFIIDAHGHWATDRSQMVMHSVDMDFTTHKQWCDVLDKLWLKRIYLTPMQALNQPRSSSRTAMRKLLSNYPDRFGYFETFDPRVAKSSERKLHTSLSDPYCVGIKIHPTFHHTDGNDMRYRLAWQLAADYDKAIMTHSWAPVAHNPEQSFSAPERFESHIKEFPQVRFVLGHAGGRPDTFDAVARLCRKYENLYIDLSGDYFHAGLMAKLRNEISNERIIFASDANWVDPSAMMAMVLSSDFPDAELMEIFVGNAAKVYL